MTSEAFERIAATIDYPMWIVTAANERERSGCLVGFTTQCSIEPVVFGVWISKANHTYAIASTADVLVVHALRASDRGLARLFGSETGDEVDKFARCTWTSGPGGAPVLDGCDWFAGRVSSRVDSGDHVGHLLEPFDGAFRERAGARLGFQDVRDIDPGHAAG